mmetsp:Transcript_1935/g.2860  ORF Transcript_1935/g.2860 Transcript_1935/m.2860 type:complete len:356 (-) Transcript_1935:354-1421(-)
MSRNDDDENEPIKITLDGLTIALIISTCLYIWCLLHVKSKLTSMHRISPDLSLQKLLILSVGLVCVVRVMSFVGVGGLNLANVNAHYSLHSADNVNSEDEDKNQRFYDAAVTVLFDLPNCIVASTYVLFALVWAECFLNARLHTDSRFKWKRGILTAYTVFNVCLYVAQTTLYCLVFWPTDSTQKIFRTILYVVVTVENFSLVFLFAGLYVWLVLHFSGYPYRDNNAKTSLMKISFVMMLWTLARVVWAVAFLVVYFNNIELLEDSDTPWWSFILIVLYLACEVVPIYFMLQAFDYIVGFDMDPKAANNISSDEQSSSYIPPGQVSEGNNYLWDSSAHNDHDFDSSSDLGSEFTT